MSCAFLGPPPLVTPVELEVVSPGLRRMARLLRQRVHRGQSPSAEQPGQCFGKTGSGVPEKTLLGSVS